MSEFEESISAPNERQFLCAVSAFSSVHGASPHLLPGGDSKQRFVNKLVDYICNNDMCSKNIAGDSTRC